jgi:hypothetical protein
LFTCKREFEVKTRFLNYNLIQCSLHILGEITPRFCHNSMIFDS